jgi:hypothetical protein
VISCSLSNDAQPSPSDRRSPTPSGGGVLSPLEAHGSYRGDDWSPERLAFHQNLESFADRVGLVVGLQANGKLSQEQAYAQIKKIWSELKVSKKSLLKSGDPS